MTSTSEPSGMVVLCDAEGVVQRVLRDDLHLEGELHVGQHIERIVDEGSREKWRNMMSALAEHGAVYGWEINLRTADRSLSVHFAGTPSNDGVLLIAYALPDIEFVYEAIAGINSEQATLLRAALKQNASYTRASESGGTGFLQELTHVNNELVNVQRELTQKNRELARLNSQKNELLGMAAHDLRNPLGVVLAYSKFLLAENVGPLNEKQSAFVSKIRTSSMFMLKMLEDLLDISQVDAGKLRLDLADVDLHAQIVNNVALNAVLAEPKGIAVTFESDEASALVFADAVKIEQVLNNLISNAVKFSPRGTAVQVTLARNDTGFEITVRDHGPGIPVEERGRLFRPFSRTSVTSTAGEKSTGLGLAIVRRIVDGHGGRVWVESEIGAGSSFHVALPRVGPQSAVLIRG